RSLQLVQLELGVCKAFRQAVDKSLPLPIKFKRSGNQPPRQEQCKQSGVGEERCICHGTPGIVAHSGANAGSNQTRRKGAQARDKDVVSRPFQFFARPKRDDVTDPIGAELEGPCAFHCPPPPPWLRTVRQFDREQATPQARTGVYCLINMMLGRVVLLLKLDSLRLGSRRAFGANGPRTSVFRVLAVAFGWGAGAAARLRVWAPAQNRYKNYGFGAL